MGMTDADVDNIVADNPRRYFEDAWKAVKG